MARGRFLENYEYNSPEDSFLTLAGITKAFKIERLENNLF